MPTGLPEGANKDFGKFKLRKASAKVGAFFMEEIWTQISSFKFRVLAIES
jgi:hypothetical protein